jgi:hypothetical protein
MREKYLRGLRFIFKSMRRHIKEGSAYGVIDGKYQEIYGYVIAGLYTDIITYDEYHKILDIAIRLSSMKNFFKV